MAIVMYANLRGNLMKHSYVLFHGGQELFLTSEGKGRKMVMVSEWLARVEMKLDMASPSQQEARVMQISEAKGLQHLDWTTKKFWPLHCGQLDGEQRCLELLLVKP